MLFSFCRQEAATRAAVDHGVRMSSPLRGNVISGAHVVHEQMRTGVPDSAEFALLDAAPAPQNRSKTIEEGSQSPCLG